ncbi:M55 family metallopeptidase [Lagierella sp. ICN-221743]
MKFYISADIEGTAGCLNWEYTMGNSTEYQEQKKIMTNEVNACVSALNENYPNCEIVIKDAHYLGNNLDIDAFPENCKIIRGWSHNPHSMVQDIDESFDGVFFIGYHNAASTGTTPLAHSFNGSKYQRIELNGELCSEFLFNSTVALHHGVKTILLSGDKGLCDEVNKIDKSIRTVYSYEGIGESILTKTPRRVQREIYETTLEASKNISKINPVIKPYELKVEYKKASECLKASNISIATQVSSNTIILKGNNIKEIEAVFYYL